MIPPCETWHFSTQRIGKRALVYDRVDSTNSLGAALAADGDSDGLVLIACEQTAGRGQHGREWRSRPGSSLLMSVVIHPPPEATRAVILTAWVAISVADAIFELTGVQTRIKWPNDLLLHGKKACGILIEQFRSGTLDTVVAGIGLNLTQTEAEFAEAYLPHATSLGIASGRDIDIRTAAQSVIQKLDAEYVRYLGGERSILEAEWKWRTGLLGRDVLVELTDGSNLTGRLHDMTFDGLEIENAEGFTFAIAPERVSHIYSRP